MNRFFSKLNLGDIRIKTEGNSFPPDADDHEDSIEESAQPQNSQATFQEPEIAESPFVAEIQAQDESFAPAENIHIEEVCTTTTSVFSTTVIEEQQTTQVTEIVSDGIVIGIGEILKVSARSRPSAVAGAIAGVVRECGKAEIQAIGAGATNQAIKAVAIARDYLNQNGIEAICMPAFIDVTIENEDRTAIRLIVEPR